jgi:hypothetical protein
MRCVDTLARRIASTAATMLAMAAALAGVRCALDKMRRLAENGGDDGA